MRRTRARATGRAHERIIRCVSTILVIQTDLPAISCYPERPSIYDQREVCPPIESFFSPALKQKFFHFDQLLRMVSGEVPLYPRIREQRFDVTTANNYVYQIQAIRIRHFVEVSLYPGSQRPLYLQRFRVHFLHDQSPPFAAEDKQPGRLKIDSARSKVVKFSSLNNVLMTALNRARDLAAEAARSGSSEVFLTWHASPVALGLGFIQPPGSGHAGTPRSKASEYPFGAGQ
jgi:hypothetical protein